MTRLLTSAALTLLLLSLSVSAFGQGGFFATVTGTVTDSSGALIPGVSIRATAVDTGVVTNMITNEAGVYSFGNLLPGKYTLNASLPGFQAKTITDVQLSAGTPYRYNFQLTVAGVNTQVEVSVSADQILATSGATVGQVLSQQKVQDLPLVGNNILDLITVMAGVENIVPTNPPSAGNAFGRENTTFAGVRADNVSIVRDGIQMQDNRNPTGVYSVTTINPDLVGEIRLILAPVDVEFGRGNGSIQYSTRSGTNRYSGAATWSVRNTALDPNTWTNNRNQTLAFNAPPGSTPQAIQPNWTNTHQLTVSYGGPIIRNKTFFFALFDFYQSRGRHLANVIVPTPCARLGIYRYFNNWTNGNATSGADGTGNNASRVSVNLDGTPKSPAGPPSGVTASNYDNSLQTISVFGPLQSKPTANDCSDAAINKTTLTPNGVTIGATPGTTGGGWDQYRQQLDLSGYISRVFAYYPLPNNWETGDGLTTAGYRYLRGFRGEDNLWGAGEATGDRRQYNVKIDHNFTTNHKANFNISYERVDSDDVKAAILNQSTPDMFSNLNYRRPVVLSGGFTSTLSSSLLNEARFGMRRQGINVIAPWHLPENQSALEALLPPDVNGINVIPNFFVQGLNLCNPHTGSRPPGSGCLGLTGTQREKTPTYTFSDTVSWTRGSHAFRFNGELRLNYSETQAPTTGAFGSAFSTFLTVTNGSITGTGPGTGANNVSNTNPAMAGLTTGNQTNARLLMSYLAGSVGNIQTLYYLGDPNNASAWSNFQNGEFVVVNAAQTEFSTFAKDEWKINKNFTLTPGIRWDYFGVPYLTSGLTVAPVGGGAAAFGISGRDFSGWMKPGKNADPTSFELVGPDSPNPNKTAYPNNYHNFGPSLSFAWQLPWFGEGKTIVRGGYQITYQGGGRFGTIAPALAAAPGTNFQAAFTTQNVYLDLATLQAQGAASQIPVPNVQPLQPLLTTGPRTASYTTFDAHYTNPYIQNLSLQVTRSVTRNLTVDVRYIGTLARKTYTQVNLNENNFLYNGLIEELSRVRTGTETTKVQGDPLSLLDQMFAGVNLCTTATCTGTFGNIGTVAGGVYQTAALQLRSSSTYQTNLANANFDSISGSLANANGNLTVPTGTVGAALRLNGFADNYIKTNPQFNAMNLYTNSGYNNYHALQVEVTSRPIHGLSGQATYNWSKNLGLLGGTGQATQAGELTNPADRRVDYTNINNNPGHSIRTNGLVELPIGPNKLFLGNSSGWLARAVERWQLGLIYNLSSGYPQSITATTMLYGNGLPDVRHPVDLNNMKGLRWGIPAGNFLEGRYFDNGDTFVKVDDPVCDTVTTLQNLANVVGGVQTRCTLNALAMVVPAGTGDSFAELDANGAPTGRNLQVVLQHPQPGKKGNLGNATVIGMGSWRFDANLSKSFRIDDSKSLAVRIDMQNVLNHPQPGNPNFSITGNSPFGQVTTKTGTRLLQGQLRLNF